MAEISAAERFLIKNGAKAVVKTEYAAVAFRKSDVDPISEEQ